MAKKCESCGFEKPKQQKDLERIIHCSICNEDFKLKDLKEHKKKNTHNIKYDVLAKIKELNTNDEQEKTTINKIFKLLTPKYKTGITDNNHME